MQRNCATPPRGFWVLVSQTHRGSIRAQVFASVSNFNLSQLLQLVLQLSLPFSKWGSYATRNGKCKGKLSG